jgi:hypothetical protein
MPLLMAITPLRLRDADAVFIFRLFIIFDTLITLIFIDYFIFAISLCHWLITPIRHYCHWLSLRHFAISYFFRHFDYYCLITFIDAPTPFAAAASRRDYIIYASISPPYADASCHMLDAITLPLILRHAGLCRFHY